MSDPKYSIPKGTREAFAELVEIIGRLRAPDGCPWDREQTHKSLKPFVIEETYEVVDAIDGGDKVELCEELGDLLLQVVLHAQVAVEDGAFDIVDVARGISRKLVSRHPHVFGDAKAENAGEVLTNWEKIKKTEKSDKRLFDGLPLHLPALQKAARMGEKAGRIGFDWETAAQAREKVEEELSELEEALKEEDAAAVQYEMGDVLFAMSQWSRHLGVQPEEALRESCARFKGRFERLETKVDSDGQSFDSMSVEELVAAWQEAKS